LCIPNYFLFFIYAMSIGGVRAYMTGARVTVGLNFVFGIPAGI